MPHLSRLFAWPRRWLPWAILGLTVRLLFIWFPRPIDDDTADYFQLGHNLLHYGSYGLGMGGDVSASLFRLPGYPLILAIFEHVFGRIWPSGWMTVVFAFQGVADVAGGLLLAAFTRRYLQGRAAELTLSLAMLCPFTAAYAGIALTESLSVFAVALGLYAVGRALTAERGGERNYWALILAGCAAGFAADAEVPAGALQVAALAGGLFGYILRMEKAARRWQVAIRRAVGATSIYCVVALLPVAVWTIRNWVQFQVFQPLAPRYLNDPGDRTNAGFYRWMRTWSLEYVDTANIFWKLGAENINPAALPPRAFDSQEQREQTLLLISEYNRNNSISPKLDDAFGALADERIREHRTRYYIEFPLLRIADMLLRPKTWEFGLDDAWWRWSDHPGESAWAVVLGVVNFFYLGAAACGFLRRRVSLAWMLGGYLLLRFILLGTMENPEPRYVLECYPIFIVAAAGALTGRRKPSAEPFGEPVDAEVFEHVVAGTAPGWLNSLCDNPKQTIFRMRVYRHCSLWMGFALVASFAWPKPSPQAAPNPVGPAPLVLTGGTLIDVTGWGHSARDVQDAVVIIREGRITDVGTSTTLPVPKGARVTRLHRKIHHPRIGRRVWRG